MTSTTADRLPRTAGGVPLKVQLRRAERRRQLKAVGLVLPLFLFIIVAFVVPIGIMLFNSVHDDKLLTLMPKTTAALSSWDGKDLPDEAAYAALVEDLTARWKDKNAAEAGSGSITRLPGARSGSDSRRAQSQQADRGRALQARHDRDRSHLGTAGIWSILKRGGSAYTPYYLLRSLDFQYGAGASGSWPPRRRTRSSATSSPAP
jgi:putative spermidine/putrescine transport system permease protein